MLNKKSFVIYFEEIKLHVHILFVWEDNSWNWHPEKIIVNQRKAENFTAFI